MKAIDVGTDLQCQQTLRKIDPRTLLIGLKTPQTEQALAQLQRSVDGIAAETFIIQDTMLQMLDTVRDLLGHRAGQGAYSPGIFTIAKKGWRRYQLRLFCEQPEAPHALPDDAGVYTFTKLPDWVRDYAPYLRLLLAGIKHGLPLIGPALTGIAGVALSETTKANLELSSKLLDDMKLPEAKTPDFHRLGASLSKLDPGLGGLLLRELPETRKVVYLCRHHADALHYPAQFPGV